MAVRLEEVKTNRPGKIQENRVGKSQDGKMKQAPKNGQQKTLKFRFGKIQKNHGYRPGNLRLAWLWHKSFWLPKDRLTGSLPESGF